MPEEISSAESRPGTLVSIPSERKIRPQTAKMLLESRDIAQFNVATVDFTIKIVKKQQKKHNMKVY